MPWESKRTVGRGGLFRTWQALTLAAFPRAAGERALLGTYLLTKRSSSPVCDMEVSATHRFRVIASLLQLGSCWGARPDPWGDETWSLPCFERLPMVRVTGVSLGPDCDSVVLRDVGATPSTAGKMAPGAAPSTSARRCKASARPRTSSTAT